MLEDNIIYSCSNSILSILSTVTGLPVWKRQDSITDAPDQIRREAERFYLWSRGYSSEGENLKYYPESIHIQFTALSTLYELGTVIKNCLLPCLDIQLPMVDISREIYRLETGLEKLLAALVEGGYEVVDYNPPPGSKNDEAALSSALEDIRVLIDCLMELSLASDDFRTEHDDSAPKYIISDSFGVSSHNALVICQNIHERFPLVPRWLIRRFGEAYSATSESFYKAELELAVEEAEEAEIPGGQNTPAPTGSLYNFTHPAARSMSHGTPSTTPLYPIGQGRMRMLQLPRAIQNGKSHTCEICSKTLNNTTSLGEWKKHIYADLRPFVCTFWNCDLECDPKEMCFSTLLEWLEHELFHRSLNWEGSPCQLCVDSGIFYTAKEYLLHFSEHIRDISEVSVPIAEEYHESSNEQRPIVESTHQPVDQAELLSMHNIDMHSLNFELGGSTAEGKSLRPLLAEFTPRRLGSILSSTASYTTFRLNEFDGAISGPGGTKPLQSSVSGTSTYSKSTVYSESDMTDHFIGYPLPEGHLPCEFAGLASCKSTFSPDHTDTWIRHICTQHLQEKLPSRSSCWFCDDFDFDSKAPEFQNDRPLAFHHRMLHIRDHILDGKKIDDMRPDYHMIEHLQRHGLITEAIYNIVMRYTELPVPREHLAHIHPPPYIPAERRIQQERLNRVYIDPYKDDRQWRKSKDKKK